MVVKDGYFINEGPSLILLAKIQSVLCWRAFKGLGRGVAWYGTLENRRAHPIDRANQAQVEFKPGEQGYF